MPEPPHPENDFLNHLSGILEENFSDEKFGVSELAHKIGMSRSNLLRKIKGMTKISASQYIRQYRLKNAMELLKDTSLTVSEVSYRVGFSSTSYFIKCFGDYYGYPPGEVGKGEESNAKTNQAFRTHRLAAIMFTDIQDYTALMQRDEEKAIKFRNRHREVFNAITKKYNGRILQYYGDGTLSTFSSAIDAVKCGIDMQLAFRMNPNIPVRIGIHTGDIVVSKEDIIGDGVNVASRIESLAVAGSVFISEKVYDEVKNQPGIQTVSMGEFELKNVTKPVEIFAVANPGLVLPDPTSFAGRLKEKKTDKINNVVIKRKRTGIKWLLIIPLAILLAYLIYAANLFDRFAAFSTNGEATKKSIAVLPFINDSNDSTNVYIINGLMESILNNLQTIEDLRVISRTSVEKYRITSFTIPEIARQLNVKYIVVGSGQKIGDQVLLNIQLIDAPDDKQIWGKQYAREAKDIFNLQREVAKNITGEIEVIITPEEEMIMEKIPTEDPVAYDYFLRGIDLLDRSDYNKLTEAIQYFEKAIAQDNEFPRANAAIAMAYYFLDEYQSEKKYTDRINYYADLALLFDAKLPQSMIAKALYYMSNKEYDLAVSYFERALEYNPNSDLVYVFLVDIYVNYLPDTEKYLEYALRGIQVDVVGVYDSVTASFAYLHISNAFVQSGFVEEAEKYIELSLDYDPDNLYSAYTKAYIWYAGHKDLQQTKDLLRETYSRDSTRLDIMQELGKIFYYLRDYKNSYRYYSKFMQIRESLNLNIYPQELAKVGLVFSVLGLDEKSEEYLEKYKAYAESDPSIYRDLSLAMYYSYKGDTEKALQYLKTFSQQDNYHYWILLFVPIDPLVDQIKDYPEFRKTMKAMEIKFWNNHKRIRASLGEKGLI